MSDGAFRVGFGPGVQADLRRRLAATRWPDAVVTDWSDGTDRAFLRSLVRTWRDDYDLAAAEQRLNALPQRRVVVDGFGVHCAILRGRGPDPTPLLLLNGWPSSFVEYGKLAPMLADPAAFGGSEADAFDVVMPALPGFGFSDRPARPNQLWAEALFHRLMVEHLGHRRYVVSGTDIGAGVARRLALRAPQAVRGIHVSAVAELPLDASSRPLDADELAHQERVKRWQADEGAYAQLHATRPQTPAFALNDSPAGLLSWIVEKFHAWSDHRGDLLGLFGADMLLDNATVYWLTETIGSSMRAYWEHARHRPPATGADRVRVPTAVCVWPKDLATPPRQWCERFYDVARYTVQPSGGHFPAWEAPEAYAEDLRAFARSLPA